MKSLENISAKVNDNFSFAAHSIEDLDFTRIDDRHFHILAQGKSYRAELIERDFRKKQFTIKINGSPYVIKLADAYDQMVERLGLSANKIQGAQDIKAPMPGLVLQIMVKDGENVSAGQPILILEAMKMEHTLTAPFAGTVDECRTAVDALVDGGSVLITLQSESD